ncbi:fungal Zn(2)-Cys(6) binuclear cluster domain-containing protein 12 [Elsinoe australis]|uniref:Fungal Zn(2)-Cys(6) binuclear cluster domain-containing protein 12 n=1 Tax=Elsinoe australis TaxID=40998 RepID=A0A2P8AIQ3_9PEZI|nr:Multidrug resistance regulator 1 [Elsinoe australis]TKX22640.1 fungal Zn(2)-Cys(6) binuclear cluster domain-containing protein 12 [Elsinoe australis]
MSWPTTPGTGLPQHSPLDSPQTSSIPRKRKKSNGVEDHSDDGDPNSGQRGRSQGVKRACNECRQQKLRCDVITEPEYKPCKRCIKHKLMCAIDPGFKRQEKRQQYAELERELAALRAENNQLKSGLPQGLAPVNAGRVMAPYPPAMTTPSGFAGSNEAAASRSLLDLASGYDSSLIASARAPTLNTLAKVSLREDQIQELFDIYFCRYHPYLPLLSTDIPPAGYFELSPLLYWTIISVASRRYEGRRGLLSELKLPLHELLWDTVGSVPQTYHVVKALCLLCAWPLPTSSTSLDPSMIICGTMVEVALQFGLHRPSHAQDFSRIKLELREEDIKDRMNTWTAVNVCAQNVSTGYGMPQISRWNWFTHGIHLERISPALKNRCLIERFIDKITRTMYTMQRDLIVQNDETQRALTIDMFAREYDELAATIKQQNPLPIDFLHLDVANLHLRLTAFFDSPSAPTYRNDLSQLYVAATTFLKTFLGLPSDIELKPVDANPDLSDPPASPFATNYIMQMVLAAGFTLMKLLNSFFASQVDTVSGRTIFLQTVSALRSISVVQNDLPQRLAEVLAQLWQASGAGGQRLFDDNGSKPDIDDSLQIKVRCRMSMSLVYDSIWRWKERFGAVRNLDRMVEHPTQPDDPAGHESDPNGSGGEGMAHMASSTDGELNIDAWDNPFGSNAPFDSLGWALDGFLELPLGNEQGFV